MKLRFLTAGESHGPELNIIVEGMPADLELLAEDIDTDLRRRQGGYGRGGRMKIEKDRVIFTAGVRHGRTFGGAPVGLKLVNRDHQKWLNSMNPAPVDKSDPEVAKELEAKFISKVRPGHADYAGAIKYDAKDVRDILERSSARETTSRVAVGAVCKKFLKQFGIEIFSQVLRVGELSVSEQSRTELLNTSFEDFKAQVENSELRIFDNTDTEEQMKEYINRIRKQGDTVGGLLEVTAYNVPVGLGSHVQWDRRLDGRIAQSLMSVHTVKSVEVGMGQQVSMHPGSKVQDEFYVDQATKQDSSDPDNANTKENTKMRYLRRTNNLGGIEGGMSNGEPIICQVGVKPIPTLVSTLDSVDLATKDNSKSHFERSDVCVVPAAGVVMEAMLAYSIAEAFLEKFAGDSMAETKRNYDNYVKNAYQR
jgi:chorismate synthase